jgi:hypothetical protein
MNPLVLQKFLKVSEYLLTGSPEAKLGFDDLKAAAPSLSHTLDLKLQPFTQGQESKI